MKYWKHKRDVIIKLYNNIFKTNEIYMNIKKRFMYLFTRMLFFEIFKDQPWM